MIGALAARNNLRVKNARQPVKRKDLMGEHKGRIRDAWGTAKSISSYLLKSLPTIQLLPKLDGCMLDIVYCFYNIVRHSSPW